MKARIAVAVLLAAAVPLLAADNVRLDPLVRGQTTEVEIASGVYFSPGPGAYIELRDQVADLLDHDARVTASPGAEARVLRLRAYPFQLAVPETAYSARGFKIVCLLQIHISPEAEPGEKMVAVLLPEVEVIGRIVHALPVWTDGEGETVDSSRDIEELRDSAHQRIPSRSLVVTFPTYRAVAEMRASVERARREKRIAEAMTHRTGDIVLGAIGCIIGLLLLFGPVVGVASDRADFHGGSLFGYAVACFIGAFLGFGGISKLHAALTGYARDRTLFESSSMTVIAGGAIAWLALTVAAWYLRSDSWAWNTACRGNAVTDFQAYLRRHHFLGRHLREADERIEAILKPRLLLFAAARFLLGRIEGLPPPGAGGQHDILLWLLEHILEKKLYREPFPVAIEYSSRYVAQPIDRAPGWKIHTAEREFTPEKNREREALITFMMKEAFGAVFPPGVLTFAQTKPKDSYAQLYTHYEIHSSGMLYFWKHQEALPVDQREFFDGVSIDWHCKFAIAGLGAHSFTLSSTPESLLSVLLDARDLAGEPEAVYREMAASAFRDFRNALAHYFLPHDPTRAGQGLATAAGVTA